jgi:hypothetical protein
MQSGAVRFHEGPAGLQDDPVYATLRAVASHAGAEGGAAVRNPDSVRV